MSAERHIKPLDDMSSALALDLAAEIYDKATIFDRHGIAEADGEELLEQPWFQQMVASAKAEWDSIGNSKERIQIKARLAVEEAIVEMYALLRDPKVPAAARVGAFKELKEIAGVVPRENPLASTAAGASISIIFGDDAATVSVTPGVTREVEDAEVVESDEFSVDTDVGLKPVGNDGLVFGFDMEDIE